MKCSKYFLFLLIVIIFSSVAYAAAELPVGIQKIQESNKQTAENYLQTFTIALVFLAGIASIFSPCILPLLPAFFAYTFKEKTNITKMTLIFFMGFSISFMLLGLASVTIFQTALILAQDNLGLIIRIFGLIMIGFGIMAFAGFGFSGFTSNKKFKNDTVGIFIYGILFAFGWSACLGPILAGILLMVSVFNNYFTAVYLMLFYSLGVFVPLLLLSIFFDKTKLFRSKILERDISIGRFKTHISKFISGILFIFTGLIFLVFGNTSIFNSSNMFGLRDYFYNFQDFLISNSSEYSLIGFIALLLFILVIYYFGFRRKDGI